MILALGEEIIFLHVGSSVRSTSLAVVVDLRVLSQIIVKGSFVACRLIHDLETSCAITDIGISSTTIVCIVDRF